MANNQFSRRSVFAAITVLERLTQAELTRYLLELGPHFLQLVGGEANSVTRRLNNAIQLVDQQPDQKVDDGGLLKDALVEKAITVIYSKDSSPTWMPSSLRPDAASLIRSLELDGFTIAEGALRRILPFAADLPKAEDEITRLLNMHGFMTPKGHLGQALDAHGRGDWAAANSQLRAFLEGLLDEIATKIDPSAEAINSGKNRRAHLANLTPPFLERRLNEWGDNGVGFINGLMARLHPHGAHPGLSDEADSTFRLHVVLVTARLLLKRFDARVQG